MWRKKKLAYAITAAYMDESGELQRRMDKQPGYVNVVKRLDALGIHNEIELEQYIKEANAGSFMGAFGSGIDVKEFNTIVEAGRLLGQRLMVTQNPGDYDQISLPDSGFKTKLTVTLDPSIKSGRY